MTNEEKLKQAMNIVTRGNDIESAKTILEAVALDNYQIIGGRVNHFRIAVRQILNYIEETQYKGILDVTREKVALKEELKKKDNRIKELESDKEIKDKTIKLMSEHLTTPIHSKKDVVEYFENLAKESGEIDEC